MKCKICGKELVAPDIHNHFKDLCLTCGLRSDKTLGAMYIVTNGKPNTDIDMKKVMELVTTKTLEEIKELGREIKRAKYSAT